MKLSDLTAISARILVCDDDAELIGLAKALARGVSDVLGVGFPCGWRDIEVVEDEENGGHIVRWDDNMEPDEARGIAVKLLRMADEAEAADEARKEGDDV